MLFFFAVYGGHVDLHVRTHPFPTRRSSDREEMTRERGAEPLPAGRLGVRHFQAVHRHLFQAVYRWAGRFRTVRIAKGRSMFCYPDRKSQHLNSSHECAARMPSSAWQKKKRNNPQPSTNISKPNMRTT